MGKRVFERWQDMESALAEGGYEEDEVFCLNKTWLRVCAPPPDSTDTCACIFWEKMTHEDNDPTWDKVVCDIFHIIHIYHSTFIAVWWHSLQHFTGCKSL